MSISNRKLTFLLAVTTLLANSSAYAIDLGDKGEYGQVKGEFRYRYEWNERDTKAADANASTARLRLGYLTPTLNGFSGYAEGETIQYVGDDAFDDGSNRKTQYPAVNDPYDTGINQLYLSYVQPGAGNSAVIGRQVMTMDNQRFIGRSNWRQNDTSYDAARFTLKPIKDLTLDYAYMDSVHRSLGSRQTLGTYDGHFHVVHGEYALPYDLKVTGYDYYLDFNNYLKTLSSNTEGGRLSWKPKAPKDAFSPFALAEVAHQSDAASNTQDYSEWYNWFELGGVYNDYSLSVAYEKMGGSAAGQFTTPLASYHTFNGWVDKFTTAPTNGLVDYQVWFKAPVPLPWEGQKLGFEAQYHNFNSDTGSQYYGQEFDIGLAYTPIENNTISLQGGRYYADGFSDDTTKAFLMYELKF